MKQYVSLSTIQTKGLKRHLRDTELEALIVRDSNLMKCDESAEPVVNALKGVKRRRLALLNKDKIQNDVNNLNTLDLEVYTVVFFLPLISIFKVFYKIIRMKVKVKMIQTMKMRLSPILKSKKKMRMMVILMETNQKIIKILMILLKFLL